jgi:hypothetical protein
MTSVEIARATALGQRSRLLGRKLSNRVARHAVRWGWRVSVGMDDLTHHGCLHQCLIAGDVEFDLGQRWLRVGPAVGDACLSCRIAPQVASLGEATVLDDQIDPRLPREPCRDAAEDLRQLCGPRRTAVDHSEVEVLRKPVGLVVALAQTGPTLENPGPRELRLSGDRGEQPPEHIVLFDHTNIELPLGA